MVQCLLCTSLEIFVMHLTDINWIKRKTKLADLGIRPYFCNFRIIDVWNIVTLLS